MDAVWQFHEVLYRCGGATELYVIAPSKRGCSVLYGQRLVDQVAMLFGNAKTRIWIAVPYLGAWQSVQRVMGTKWIGDLRVDIRLLTDITIPKALSRDSVSIFQNRAEVRSLQGLHAKAYIVDDKLVLTSANLTGTAFARRWEIGHVLTATKSNIAFFQEWWDRADPVETTWLPPRPAGGAAEPDEAGRGTLPQLWTLPAAANGPGIFSTYLDQIKAYDHFRRLYSSLGRRILPSLPIYQEIDDFLNFLYHEHENLPSRPYIRAGYRRMSDDRRREELKLYKAQYRKWNAGSNSSADARLKRIRTIQRLLNPRRIERITRQDIAEVAHWINAISSYPWNLTSFLSPKYNSTAAVRRAWATLLHDRSRPLQQRMSACKGALTNFGKSSIQELLSYYYPNEYPVVNRNPNAGLKFFGYKVQLY